MKNLHYITTKALFAVFFQDYTMLFVIFLRFRSLFHCSRLLQGRMIFACFCESLAVFYNKSGSLLESEPLLLPK